MGKYTVDSSGELCKSFAFKIGSGGATPSFPTSYEKCIDNVKVILYNIYIRFKKGSNYMNYTIQFNCSINYTHAITEQDISKLKDYALQFAQPEEIKNFWLNLTKDKAEDVIIFISSALHPVSSFIFEAKYGISEDAACSIYYTALAFFIYSAKNDKDFPHNSASIKISDIGLSDFTFNN